MALLLSAVPDCAPLLSSPYLSISCYFRLAFISATASFRSCCTGVEGQLPEYLQWLNFVLWPLAVLSLIVVMAFVFSSVMNWLAAPFNGLLAEKAEQLLTGKPVNTGGALDTVKDIPRMLGREWIKLKYYLPRAVLFLLLFWVPLVGQMLAPVFWFLFSAWMMAVQYCDYPFDNHRVAFDDMKFALKTNPGQRLQFRCHRHPVFHESP